MPGFWVIINNSDNNQTVNSGDIEYFSLKELVIDNKSIENSSVGRFTTPKFSNDKVFFEDEESFILIEGVIYNYKELLKNYAASDYPSLLKKMYKQKADSFFNEFKGEFSGIFFDKAKDKWLVFTNHIASKPVFYYQSEGLLIVASELKVLAQILRNNNIRYTLDTVGAYFLLTYGYMLEDYTLISEVKKLMPGNSIKFERGKLDVAEYHTFKNIAETNDSKDKIIDNIDHLFCKAIDLEYQKDIEYGYRHISTLSGGLDSRMNVMVADQLGYKKSLNFTFSQKNYYDEKIARKIAADLGNSFVFYSLENGGYLMDVEHPVRCNDGLILYSGAAHLLSCLKSLDLCEFGLIHSGQVGDAILGSFLSEPNITTPKITSGAYSKKLLSRIESEVENIVKKYEREEDFLLYTRGFNGAINGNWMASQFTEVSSPFLDTDFIEYCFSIPPKMKYKQKIYIEWILSKRSTAANYMWEKTKTKPSTARFLPFCIKMCRRLLMKIVGNYRYSSMNPFNYWYSQNEELRNYMRDYICNNIDLLSGHGDLYTDVQDLALNGTFLEKTQAMTLIEACKLFFGAKDE